MRKCPLTLGSLELLAAPGCGHWGRGAGITGQEQLSPLSGLGPWVHTQLRLGTEDRLSLQNTRSSPG